MMRLVKGFSIGFLVFAALFIALAVIHGEIEMGIAVFIPFLIGSGFYAFLGFICLFIGMIFLFLSIGSQWNTLKDYPLNNDDTFGDRKASKQISGVVFIGPFPIMFGLGKKITRLLVLIAIFGIVSVFIIYYFLL